MRMQPWHYWKNDLKNFHALNFQAPASFILIFIARVMTSKNLTCKPTCKLQSTFQFCSFVTDSFITGWVTIVCVSHIQIRTMVWHHPLQLFPDDSEWRPFSGIFFPTLLHQFIPEKMRDRCQLAIHDKTTARKKTGGLHFIWAHLRFFHSVSSFKSSKKLMITYGRIWRPTWIQRKKEIKEKRSVY